MTCSVAGRPGRSGCLSAVLQRRLRGDRNHAKNHSALFSHRWLSISAAHEKVVVRDEPPLKMSKLAIAAGTEADRCDVALAVKCLACGLDDLDKADLKLAPVVEGIMTANTFSRKEGGQGMGARACQLRARPAPPAGEPRTIESRILGIALGAISKRTSGYASNAAIQAAVERSSAVSGATRTRWRMRRRASVGWPSSWARSPPRVPPMCIAAYLRRRAGR